ncbi:MAG: hypothetical protein JWP29_1137, partial [Rhodoferax sp.]|nr:hypothetical protein [Rhodoferax sp.]
MSSFAAKPTQRSSLLRRVASARSSRGIARRCVWWCAAWILLSALQPFIAVHFRGTGWEDEPGVHVRSSGESARFEYDDDDDAQDAGVHPAVMETTVFVPLGVDDPGAESLSQWLDHVLIALM